MIKRSTQSQWNGTLKDGQGTMRLQSGAYQGPFTFSSRFESGDGTNPEELIAAAHSGCFSMFLSALLSEEGLSPEPIHTEAQGTLEVLDDGPKITQIHLQCQATVSGIDETAFQALVQKAKDNCPISKVLQGADDITVLATLNTDH